ncbi:hypothetical protein LAV84_30760 [Rhizobium sp. VS19-DR104.2]|uniref:hypothetical protein n=1 Tax=unclassified Rhizobium TaxID=2613769 RepID=UPI001C5BA18E|nr:MULTISPECIES: hypothetical protein [unclassified Rhizobium]MBZ5763837.1 hypothetical protein [Rhizobium sp. VS19-DR96]MBZ5769773.1 hypothetical protein [Rhizobium sp. VS19-DR129.2]MBZ5777316.1 hypothetical protein [Rhizobium sp. VS19-DRK62.2]MBZ5788434.1 hypothetical protein [Rhizobium sp. VS19-DR121]MBZ5805883.1 hypothetical protein [Rhizobium sp. VS19-DR181]
MSKHPIVPGTELIAVRNLLRKHEEQRDQSLLATTIEELKCPAREADAFLRRLAIAGYIEWKAEYAGSSDWSLTEHGLRLAADDFGPRMTPQRAHAVIGQVIERARAINRDPDRLARVRELRLFGSTLDPNRPDYGDVDIEAEIEIRQLPVEEVAAARSKIAVKVPLSWRQHLILRLDAEGGYDGRNAFGALKKGLKGLSLSRDATRTLGCEFRRIYRFDLEAGNELAPDDHITPRTTPPPKNAGEVSPTQFPEHTVIEPLGIADADEKIRTEKISLSVQSLSRMEAKVWLGVEKRDGSRVATNTRKDPSQRFAGAKFLFDEWRDPNLTGLELFQRSLDWAALYDLAISKIGRKFSLRTYQGARVANFNALMVQRVADRVDAHLALNRPKGNNPHSYQRGGATFTTPRMIAANHALAVALARMLDETGLTGQTTFRAEFELTDVRRNFYPALPDLSEPARRLKTALEKVTFPEALILESRKQMDEYETNLPLHREIEVAAADVSKKEIEIVGFASSRFGVAWNEDEDGIFEDPDKFFPGEELVWEIADGLTDLLKARLVELPGCRLMKLGQRAPISAKA